MIEHLVFFKLKSACSNKDKQQLVDALKSLKNKIPEILEMSCGENFSKRGKGYDLGLRVLFYDEKDLEVYQTHPQHLAVIEGKIKPNIDDLVVMDFPTK